MIAVQEAFSFLHLDIAHIKPSDFLLLKKEEDFFVLHLNHKEGIMFDTTPASNKHTRKWLEEKGYSRQFIHELLERIPAEYDWLMLSQDGEHVDELESFAWV